MEFSPDDIRKLYYTFVAFFVVVPILGVYCARSQWHRRALMLGCIFLPSMGNAKFLGLAKINFTLMSVETYRGHTTGFTIGMQDILGVALLLALFLSRRGHRFRLIPPGLFYFAVFYVCISVSIFQAPITEYSLMAMWNFGRMFLYYIIAYNIIRQSGDLRTILWGIALTLMVQCAVSLKMRYLGGVHQVAGTFDHQNSMATWAYFCGLPMLAMSLSRQTKWVDSLVYLTAFGCSGLLVVLSISRGALIMITLGSIAIITHAAIQKMTIKRSLIIGAAVACGSFVILMALDSILGRFIGSHDYEKKQNLRTVLEEVSYEMLKDNPHGVGLNNYNVVNSRPYARYSRMLERWNERRGYYFPIKYFEKNPNTENLYWMFLAETGYLGFAGLMVFFAFSFYICLKNYHHYRNTRQGSFILGMIVTLALFYMHSQLERVFTQSINMMVFIMYVSLVVHYDSVRREGKLPIVFRLWKLNQAFWDTRKERQPRPQPIKQPSPAPKPSPAHS
ncbi:MAG: O-antigen ligase [Verrucomicrobiales bacterium]